MSLVGSARQCDLMGLPLAPRPPAGVRWVGKEQRVVNVGKLVSPVHTVNVVRVASDGDGLHYLAI